MLRINSKVAAVAAALLVLALLIVAAIGFFQFDEGPMFLIGHDFPHDHWLGNILGLVIASCVLVLVGAILTVVFAGVSLLLLIVGLLVATLLLAIALPFLLPVLAVLAVPVMAAYGLVQLIRNNRRPAV